MRDVYLISFLACVLAGCSTPARQTIAVRDGWCQIDWAGSNVVRINCKCSEMPGGALQLTIKRADNEEIVKINDESNPIWSRDVFTAKESIHTGSDSGDLVYHGESKYVGPERHDAQEWRLKSHNILLYQEVTVVDGANSIKRRDIVGPFGIPLAPPDQR